MTGFALLLALGFFLYRASRQRHAPRPAPMPRPVTRAEAAGDAGEALVDAALRQALTWLCGENFYLHAGPVLLHHAPGMAYPTAEVDHLAITPFGLFVFETKNWSGRIEPGADADTLIRIAADGSRDVRRSPIRQNRSKLAFLRGVMPGMWPVHGFGVFSSPACVLSPALPRSVIRVADIDHQLRLCQKAFDASGQRPVNVAAAWQAVLSVAETDAGAIAKHRLAVEANPIY